MKIRIWIALFAVYLFWGATYLGIRFAVESIPPFLMASTRFLIAGVILFAWRYISGDPTPTWLQWRSAIMVGLLLLLGGNGAVVWAEQYVDSGIAALLVGTVPLWMVLIDAIWPGRPKPFGMTILGVVVGFIGVVILISPAYLTTSAHQSNSQGLTALLFAAFSWALGSLYNSEAPLPESPLLGTSMIMIAGSASLALFGTLVGEWGRLELAAITGRSLSGLFYLIVFGSLIAFVAYTWLLRVAPISLVSTYAYVNPLVAIILGNILAQEALTFNLLISAAMIISAVSVIGVAQNSRIKKSNPLKET